METIRIPAGTDRRVLADEPERVEVDRLTEELEARVVEREGSRAPQLARLLLKR